MSKLTGLSISIVSYFHDLPTLTATLDSLNAALDRLAATTSLRATVVIVDNSEAGTDAPRLRQWLAQRSEFGMDKKFEVRLKVNQVNSGYGAGNNTGQADADGAMADIAAHQRWVLILNPDVVLDEAALLTGITTLQAHPTCSMLSPRATSEAQQNPADDGDDLYLAHRYPSWRVLALRAAAPSVVTSGKPAWACTLMQRYECRDLPPDQPHTETICASGCFMLMPYHAWRQAGGFDERFFLYFEDYDLSCRLLSIGPVIYEPAVRIQHAGGKAAGKSGHHRQWFAASAIKFFWANGWPRRRHRLMSAETQVLGAGSL